MPVLAGCSALLFVLVLVRLNGLMVDVGEYRRTERQMREAEAKYRSLVEGLPAVVYIAEFGKDAAWTYISPKVESILGFTPDEWTGQADLWRERILPEDRELALDAENRILNGEPRMQCEYRIIGKNGRVIWIHEEAEALADDGWTPRLPPGRDVRRDRAEERRGAAREGPGHREGGGHQAPFAARDAELVPAGGLPRPPHAAHQHPRVRPHARGQLGQRADLPRGRARPGGTHRDERPQAPPSADQPARSRPDEPGHRGAQPQRRRRDPDPVAASWRRAPPIRIRSSSRPASGSTRTSTPRRWSGSSRTWSPTRSATRPPARRSGSVRPDDARAC